MSTPVTSTTGHRINYNGREQHLTPRTPHSRAGKPVTSFDTEETRSKAGDDHDERGDMDEVDMLYTQTSPLLRSSASASFPPPPQARPRPPVPRTPKYQSLYHRESTSEKFQNAIRIIPLALGAMGALALLVMILLSVHRPQVLQHYILKNTTSTNSSSNNLEVPLKAGIDYSNHTEFPLQSIEYEEECWRVMDGHDMSHGDYWSPMKDADMMDVPHEDSPDTCSSTITYLLDGSVGLFYDLALIAQAAAFARERNRTFIIDDTKWNRGRWTDHFLDVRKTQPGPEPGCQQPPPDELVACPRTARHWVITQRTAKFHFGHGFSDAYEDPYKSDMTRFKPIYDHAYESFKHTIQLNPSLRNELTKLRQQQATKPYVGIHIRHGDRFPENSEWRQDYVPISQYVNAAEKMWEKLSASSEVQEEDPTIYLATDSYASFQDFLSLSPTPEKVWGLSLSTNHKWRYMASPQGYVQRVFEGRKTRPEERKRWTQGVILDFAMISGAWIEDGERAPLGVICTSTSNVCRMAAVGFGWDRSLMTGMWVDLDWHGLVWPIWKGFEVH